jgi:ribosomal protein S18 acetylase RimI-like enzyme
MSEDIRVRILCDSDRAGALEYLRANSVENLVLLDFTERLGRVPRPGEIPPQLFGGFDGDRLVGVVLLRPCVAISCGMTDRVLEALTPHLMRVPSGLMKSERGSVERIWKGLEALGRRSSIDRVEVAFQLVPDRMVPATAELPGVSRPARSEDLEELVYAARASLWEEDRPDPADGDPVGFRRWVESRLSRARIVSEEGRMVFVAYADVRRADGWLIQGVYTWPEARRRGFARRGMDSIVREAFASGASHVQLAVVEGNERALALYRELGFEQFAELRTVLFS